MQQTSGDRPKAMELKYCEQCGALWVRARGEEQSVCGGCRGVMRSAPRRWSAELKQKQARRRAQPDFAESKPMAVAMAMAADPAILQWMEAKGGVA